MDTNDLLLRRVEQLERANRRGRRWLALLGVGCVAAVSTGFAGRIPDELRTTKLVIVDDQGRERMILAGKVPDPREGKRITQGPGMQLLNKDGMEQFGLSMDDATGQIGLGLDARPGAGDDRNRERFNIVVGPKGEVYVNLKDGRTRRKTVWYVDQKGEAALGFDRWKDEGKETKYVGMRRLSADGDKSVKG